MGVGSVEVAPAVHGQHGLLETCSEGGPVATIFIEEGDGVREYWEGHNNVVGHMAAMQLVLQG